MKKVKIFILSEPHKRKLRNLHTLVMGVFLSIILIGNAQAQTVKSAVVLLDAPNDALNFDIMDDGCAVTTIANGGMDAVFTVGNMIDTDDPLLGVMLGIDFLGSNIVTTTLTADITGSLGTYTTACGDNYAVTYTVTWVPFAPPFATASRGEVRACISTTLITSTCTLSCEGTIQVSLDGDCEAVITPAIMLSDDGFSCPDGDFVVELSDQYGPIVDNILTHYHIGQEITATVRDLVSGNSCWGYVVVEDKIGPTVECPDDPVILSCADFNELVTPVFTDACQGSVPAILLSEETSDYTCDPNYVKEIQRVYYALDSDGFASETCTITYLLERIDFDDVVCPKNFIVKEENALNCDGTWDDYDCSEVGFAGGFAPANWTFAIAGTGTDAAVDVTNAPGSVTLTATSDGTAGVNTDTDLCIAMPCDGSLEFMWSAEVMGGGAQLINDEPAYVLNGTETILATGGASSASGMVAITVAAGDVFCFRVKSNNTAARNMTVFSGISLNNCIVFDTDTNGDGINDTESNGLWDDDGDGYPDTDEVGVPTIGGIPIYPTPDFYCNAGVFYSDIDLPKIGCTNKVMRVWSFREWWCGQELEETCTQIIEITDDEAPVMTCQGNLCVTTNTTVQPSSTQYHGLVSCGANVAIPLPPTTDNCSEELKYDITFPGGFISDYNGTDYINVPLGENTVKLTVYDECYNSSSCEFIVTVKDDTPPVTVCDQYTVVSLTHQGKAHVFAESLDDGSYDDCKMEKMLIRRMDDNCGCEYPKFNDMTYMGEHNGHHYYVSNDSLSGYLAMEMAEAMGGYLVTINNSAENKFLCDHIQSKYSDNYYIGAADLGNNPCDHYSGIDGNFDWVNGEIVTYTNWQTGQPNGTGHYAVLNKDCRWYDEDAPHSYPYILEIEDPCGWSREADFCCEDLGTDRMVAFRTVDCFGNFNDCMVTVEVQDKLVPTIHCPPDMTFSCDEVYDLNNMGSKFGEAFVTENCSATMVEVVTGDLNQCNVGVLTRSFIATNASGAVDSCHQYLTFTRLNPFDGDDIDWPDDDTFYGCLNPDEYGPDVTGYPGYTGSECDLLGSNYEDDLFTFNNASGEACFKIIRHWTVIDWCTRVLDQTTGLYSHPKWYRQQILKLGNEVAPEIQSCEDLWICNYDANCGPIDVDIFASATDDCTTELSWEFHLDLDSDDVYDYEESGWGPVVSGNGVDTTAVTITRSLPNGVHRVYWQFRDKCGNLKNCTQEITVSNCKAPTPYCINGLAVDLMPLDTDGDNVFDTGMVELWASDFDAGSYHPCGNEVFLSFSADTSDRFIEFTCDNLGDQTVEIWATIVGSHHDEFIQSYCETYVNVQDNNNACGGGSGMRISRIAGEIMTERDETIENVSVVLEGSELDAEYTDETGEYAFPDMPLGGSYVINPTRNDDHLNGVSTLDLVLIQRHILGLEALDSPYKIIAGDINSDEKLSSIDLIELRKLILGIYDELPENTSWRFVDELYAFFDPTSPLNENFSEIYDIPELSDDMTVDFIGLKVGDVNATATTNLFNSSVVDTRNRTKFQMEVRSIDRLSSTQVEIPIYASENSQCFGMQMTIELNPMTSFNTLKAHQLNVNNDNVGLEDIENGLITFSWNKAVAYPIDADQPLFSIVLDTESNMELNYPINLSSESLSAEIYTEIGSIETPVLSYRTLTGNENTFELFQNIPNPFRNTTEINFNLPAASSATLTITDVTGKTIRVVEGNFTKGLNTIEIDSKDIGTSGFLYYTLKTDNNTATRKMVVVK